MSERNVFHGYEHKCSVCSTVQPLCPDYYGLIYRDQQPCIECQMQGVLECTDTKMKYYWYEDGSVIPRGPFETREAATLNAEEGGDK